MRTQYAIYERNSFFSSLDSRHIAYTITGTEEEAIAKADMLRESALPRERAGMEPETPVFCVDRIEYRSGREYVTPCVHVADT